MQTKAELQITEIEDLQQEQLGTDAQLENHLIHHNTTVIFHNLIRVIMIGTLASCILSTFSHAYVLAVLNAGLTTVSFWALRIIQTRIDSFSIEKIVHPSINDANEMPLILSEGKFAFGLFKKVIPLPTVNELMDSKRNHIELFNTRVLIDFKTNWALKFFILGTTANTAFQCAVDNASIFFKKNKRVPLQNSAEFLPPPIEISIVSAPVPTQEPAPKEVQQMPMPISIVSAPVPTQEPAPIPTQDQSSTKRKSLTDTTLTPIFPRRSNTPPKTVKFAADIQPDEATAS